MLSRQATPTFAAALRDVRAESAKARADAAMALARAEPEQRDEACAALRPLLDDTEPGVRFAAIAAAGDLRDEGALDAILARFDDSDPNVREAAIISAARIGDRERAERPLLRALGDARPEVRFQAAISAAELLGEGARGGLAALVADDDAKVRGNAIAALATLAPHAPTTERIARALSDADLEVRLEAALALAKAQDGRGLTVLRSALRHPERNFEVMDALGVLGAGGAKDAAEDLGKLASAFLAAPLVKAAASAALARMGDPRGVEGLRAALAAWREGTREYALGVVAVLGLDALAPEVLAIARKPGGVDREILRAALGALAGRSPEARAALADLGLA